MSAVAVVVLLVWLIAGSFYARREAAQEYERRQQIGEPDLPVLDTASHEYSCDYRRRGDKCDCTHRREFRKAMAIAMRWDALTDKPIVEANYFHVLLWPIFLHRAFLLANAGQESRRDRRRRIELENARHIAEVTSILEGNQRTISSLDLAEESAS